MSDFDKLPPHQKLGDAPIEPSVSDLMNSLARGLDQLLNGELRGTDRPTGFVLMVFPFNEIAPGGLNRCNYISNGADRKDIVVLMKEMIRRFEGQPEMKGHA